MSRPVAVPGARDVRGVLDVAAADAEDANGVVVACPPHPGDGGDRNDERLGAVSQGLTDRGIDCLRVDYGPSDDGRGEQTDTSNAIGWAAKEYEHVGVFGYSFGAAMALLATADRPEAVDVTSVLAPPARVGDSLDIVRAVAGVSGSLQVVYGADDTTVDWRPVVERARELGHDIRELHGDHFFVGRQQAVAEACVPFLAAGLA
jgi:alpha/beta superfamily hydrolase